MEGSPMMMRDGRPVDMPSLALHMEQIGKREIEAFPRSISFDVRGRDGTPYLSVQLGETQAGVVGMSITLKDPPIKTNLVFAGKSLHEYLTIKRSAQGINLVSLCTELARTVDEFIKNLQSGD
jgi:hypothetical protein